MQAPVRERRPVRVEPERSLRVPCPTRVAGLRLARSDEDLRRRGAPETIRGGGSAESVETSTAMANARRPAALRAGIAVGPSSARLRQRASPRPTPSARPPAPPGSPRPRAPPVLDDSLVRRPSNATVPSLSRDGAVAEPLDRRASCETKTIVPPRCLNSKILPKHLRWNGLVADGEDLVEQQHVRLDVRRDREAEPHVHPRRVRADRQVDEVLEPGERDDLVELLADDRAPTDRGSSR